MFNAQAPSFKAMLTYQGCLLTIVMDQAWPCRHCLCPPWSPVPVGKVVIYVFNGSKGSKEVLGAGNLKRRASQI